MHGTLSNAHELTPSASLKLNSTVDVVGVH